MIQNKKGAEMSINTIILIVLGVFILVIIIVAVIIGFGPLKERLFPSKSNVDTIKQACDTACSTASKYDYCSMERNLRDEKGNEYNSGTCYLFATTKPEFGIKECSDINCDKKILLSADDTTKAKVECEKFIKAENKAWTCGVEIAVIKTPAIVTPPTPAVTEAKTCKVLGVTLCA